MLPLMILGCVSWTCVSDRSAEFWKVDTVTLRAIIQVESTGCKFIYNRKSGDSGCAQVNKVHFLGFRDMQLLSDYRFSIPIGAYLLSRTKRLCEYNLGRAGAKKYPESCLKYERMVLKQINKLNGIRKKTTI